MFWLRNKKTIFQLRTLICDGTPSHRTAYKFVKKEEGGMSSNKEFLPIWRPSWPRGYITFFMLNSNEQSIEF